MPPSRSLVLEQPDRSGTDRQTVQSSPFSSQVVFACVPRLELHAATLSVSSSSPPPLSPLSPATRTVVHSARRLCLSTRPHKLDQRGRLDSLVQASLGQAGSPLGCRCCAALPYRTVPPPLLPSPLPLPELVNSRLHSTTALRVGTSNCMAPGPASTLSCPCLTPRSRQP